MKSEDLKSQFLTVCAHIGETLLKRRELDEKLASLEKQKLKIEAQWEVVAQMAPTSNEQNDESRKPE